MPLLRSASAACAALLLIGAAPARYPVHPVTSPDIKAADIAARDKAIADDAFEGRGPGTVNGEASAQWIADELKRIGVKPGNHGSYFQNVAAAVIALDGPKSAFSFATREGSLTPNFPEAVTYWTPQYAAGTVEVKDAPLVFVGYGVVAPEYGWNDYAGIDVKGKTVVILVNDPGNEDAAPDPAFFKGKAMTYYGRWTYKYEEAARQGAAAAIIVHETVPAAYGWNVVRNSHSGSKYWLENKDKNGNRVKIEGWVTLDTAKDLFKRAGLDYATLKAAANKRGFKAVEMAGETLSVHAVSHISHVKTRNVVGVIPGKKAPGDVVMFSAHWDHLGIKPELPGTDKIYNGAVDNGYGVSMILELAEAFVHDGKPERSIGFAFWTMEEQGLLGSEYFAEHPVWPLRHIVGVVNLDGGIAGGRARDMSLSGSGQSELEDVLADALKTQNRVISPDSEPEKGGFFRSDHFSLARAGVPAITPGGGEDLIDGGKARAKALGDDYLAHHYHQPSDEFDPKWDFSGMSADVEILHTLGDTLANSDKWPNWHADSEFRTARDKVMKAK
ncbi:M28 family metallopeptidase [Rhizomicrobium electricum]|jgi:Zn-dependent M28 family amino/carboxypeptidase|uniref:M28 family metallopeptidase n=1 Tax=Rhizomicrobium electricum TaxID=480070 RepID=A0ABN1E1J8_9PROT|nr:M28 family metallopeptidase [Rhizomicrobium electricum]NIJ47430.1 Zn-dependent M28 family amino/carboxypeptidase [Rhizomicrobium electricum]